MHIEIKPANLSIGDSAIRLGVSRATVYRMIDEGHLRRITHGRKVLIPNVDVEKLIKDMHSGKLVIGPRPLRKGEEEQRKRLLESIREQRARKKKRSEASAEAA